MGPACCGQDARRGMDVGPWPTPAASADPSLFSGRGAPALALPYGRNRHLVTSLARGHALIVPDVVGYPIRTLLPPVAEGQLALVL